MPLMPVIIAPGNAKGETLPSAPAVVLPMTMAPRGSAECHARVFGLAHRYFV